MESLNRIGRALLVVSALAMPTLASAEAPPAGKPGAAAKKDATPKAKKAHKGAKADDKSTDPK